MNHEEDEDEFLYGDKAEGTLGKRSEAVPSKPIEHEMEQASEEGEVEDEEEEESDSVATS